MAQASGTVDAASPTRRKTQDRLSTNRPRSVEHDHQEPDRGASLTADEAPRPTLGGGKSKFRAAVSKAVKVSPSTATKKPSISDVVQQALSSKRDPNDKRRIILRQARQLKDANDAKADASDEPDIQTAAKKSRAASLQAVVRSTKNFLLGSKVTSTFKDCLTDGHVAATFGALLQEDPPMDKVRTTLESLAVEVPPQSASIADKLRAMTASVDEIKVVEEQCSEVIERVRLIPGAVAEAYANWATEPDNLEGVNILYEMVQNRKALDDELTASEVDLKALSTLFVTLEQEYDSFRRSFMRFNPMLLPVCWAGHTMNTVACPQDKTVICENCHAPSRSLISEDQDRPVKRLSVDFKKEEAAESWERHFSVMWHCAVPLCNEKTPYYLCKPCGKVKFSLERDKWLKCASLPPEWLVAKEDAYTAVIHYGCKLDVDKKFKTEMQGMRSSPTATASSSSSASSQDPYLVPVHEEEDATLGPVHEASCSSSSSSQDATLGRVHEEELEKQSQQDVNPQRTLTSDAFEQMAKEPLPMRRHTTPDIPGCFGPDVPYSQRSTTPQPDRPARSATPQPGTKSPRPGRQKIQDSPVPPRPGSTSRAISAPAHGPIAGKFHRSSPSSGNHRDSKPAAQGNGLFKSTAIAVAFTTHPMNRGLDQLNDPDLSQEEVDTRRPVHVATPRRSFKAKQDGSGPVTPRGLEFPVTEPLTPRRPVAYAKARPKALISSKRESKEWKPQTGADGLHAVIPTAKDSHSPRQILTINTQYPVECPQLGRAASTPNGQSSPATRPNSRASFGGPSASGRASPNGHPDMVMRGLSEAARRSSTNANAPGGKFKALDSWSKTTTR